MSDPCRIKSLRVFVDLLTCVGFDIQIYHVPEYRFIIGRQRRLCRVATAGYVLVNAAHYHLLCLITHH
ncbi:hypothetical protein ES705_49656 [subsurface metagenome]